MTVTVRKLRVNILNQALLTSVSCTALAGRVTFLIGGSGAGKTTLLKSIAGLIPVAEGTIVVDGQDIVSLCAAQRAEVIGYVFQDFNLFPHMTVIRNCIDPLLVHGIAYDDAYQRAVAVLRSLGMEDKKDRYPKQLSGGQQQRVAIARALCLRPRVLLLDEPTASLDPVNTSILVTIIKTLAQQGLTLIIASQDMSFVRQVFDQIYYMDAGRITQYCDNKQAVCDYPLIQKFLES